MKPLSGVEIGELEREEANLLAAIYTLTPGPDFKPGPGRLAELHDSGFLNGLDVATVIRDAQTALSSKGPEETGGLSMALAQIEYQLERKGYKIT